MSQRADIGIIGGTGIYDPGLFSERREVKVHTPYGEPSDLVTIGDFFRVFPGSLPALRIMITPVPNFRASAVATTNPLDSMPATASTFTLANRR